MYQDLLLTRSKNDSGSIVRSAAGVETDIPAEASAFFLNVIIVESPE
jgi:hypothetical protein